ncbi:SMI1/KNR4 family protein [Streptomyces sp. NPDC006259]|uniref:SMI1/KNR4 family protein n=1 Tax=Streptomyces sp. NPDC006259 TaxID=3364740 RepID=UPI0036C9A887
MDIEQADPAELAALREAFAVDGGGDAALGWEAVRAFEAEHAVVLPEPYRTFVAEMSDGSLHGPPLHGLVRLAEAARNQRPALPFPLTRAWLWEEDEGAYDDPEAVIGQVAHHGSLVLGTDGCGMDWHLVVTGPCRGRLWLVTGEGALPYGAAYGSTTAGSGFAGWVRHWSRGDEWFDTE